MFFKKGADARACLYLINVGIVMQEYKKSFPMGCLIFRMVGNGLQRK